MSGVEIVDSSVSITGDIQEGESNDVDLSVTITSNTNGGAASGSGLWQITGFLSDDPDGNGTRYDEQTIPLSTAQSGTTLNPGETATVSGLTYTVDLQDGPACSEFGYVCTTVEKGSGASPDFDLSPAETTTCVPVDCTGTTRLVDLPTKYYK